jgi:hypothetical protein
MYGISYMFWHYIAIFSGVVSGDVVGYAARSLDTTRPSTIFYRLLLS